MLADVHGGLVLVYWSGTTLSMASLMTRWTTLWLDHRLRAAPRSMFGLDDGMAVVVKEEQDSWHLASQTS